MDIIIGISPTSVRALADGPEFKVGTLGSVSDVATGTVKDFMYVKSTAGLTDVGYVVLVAPLTFDASMITTATSATGVGFPVGVAQAPIAAGGWGWVQIYGSCTVRTTGAFTAGTASSTSPTAGTIQTGTVTGAWSLVGVAVTTTAAGAQATTGYVTYPTVRGPINP